MLNKLIFLLVVTIFAFTVVAQEDVPTDAEDAAAADQEAVAGSAEPADEVEEAVEDIDDGVLDEAFEDESLDEQTYEEDEDDFVPTEEIPADEPIPFPSNI